MAILEKNIFQPAQVERSQFSPPQSASQPAGPVLQRRFRLSGLAPSPEGGWRALLEMENPGERRWVRPNDRIEFIGVLAVDARSLKLEVAGRQVSLAVGEDSDVFASGPMTVSGPWVLTGLYVSGRRKRAMLRLGDEDDPQGVQMQIRPGDRLAGGLVRDITDQAVLVERDGTTLTLKVGATAGSTASERAAP